MRAGRIFVAIAVAALGLGLMSGTAMAKKKKTGVVFFSGYPKVTGNNGNVQARGTLNTASECKFSRGMGLFLIDLTNGAILGQLDGKTSDSNGNWRLQGRIPSRPAGSNPVGVQAKANKRKTGSTFCKAGLSPVVPVTAPRATTLMAEEHASSTVSIRNTAPSTFKGRVGSDNDSCVGNRTVKLLQVGSDGPKVISNGVSDDNGVWRVALEGNLTGQFFAKVTAKRVGSLNCDKARSKTITV